MSEFKSKRQPIRFKRYFEIHDSYMESYEKRGLVVRHTINTVEDDDPITGIWTMSGQIVFRDSLYMEVEKTLLAFEAEDGHTYISTVSYSYCLVKKGIGNIFRYCSPHGDKDSPSAPEYHKYHHKHVFDPPGVKKCVELITDRDWPTLGEAIEEVEKHLS